ncbi:MAG: MFS transporter [Pseudomonadales bacterium]|nr:MFS transporter [Pseudomonadales bacterium]
MSPENFPVQTGKRILLFALIAVGMGQTVLFAVLAPLGREIGLLEVQVGAIISASSITVFLCTPIWGRTSDRWGRKRVMLVGLFGYAMGTVLFAMVFKSAMEGFFIPVVAFIALIVARMMHAVVMSATMPAASAYMADITTVAERTRGMGQVGAANNVGAILGPALGGGLAVFSLLTPLWFSAAIAVFAGLIVWKFLPDVPRQVVGHRPPKMKRTDPRILPFMIVGVTMFMGFAIVQQTMAFRFQDALGLTGIETARTFGIGMMLSAGCSLFSQAILVQHLDLKPFSLMKLAMPLLIIAFGIMATFESELMLLGSMCMLGLGMGLAGPGFTAGASLAVSPEEQGAVAGVAGSCGPLGFTIGPLVGTWLYSLQPEYPYIFTLVVYIPLLIFVLMQKERPVHG